MEIDEAIALVGGWRRWTTVMFIGTAWSCFVPLAGINMMFVFIAWTPPHHCKVPNDTLLNQTIPVDPSQWNQEWSKCSMYVNSSVDNDTMSCQNGWTYYTEGEKTIVTEFDLVCQYNYLAELCETLSMMSCIIADLVIAVAVDKFGRKYIHHVGLVMIIVCGTCLSMSTNFYMFMVFRPLCALAITCINLPGSALFIELFNSKRRVKAGLALECSWTFSYMYVALLGYLIPDWRKLVLVISLVPIVFLPLICTIPESVWWLVANNRLDEAEEILQKMAKYNGVKVNGRLLGHSSKKSDPKDDNEDEKLMTNKSEDKAVEKSVKSKETPAPHVEGKTDDDDDDFYVEKCTDLVTNRILLKHTIIACLQWFACELVYYGLILTTPSLAGNKYLNFFFGGLVEVPAYLLVYPVMSRGRKVPVVVCYILAGGSLIAATLTPATTASGISLTPLILTWSLLGKFFIYGSFAIVMMYCRELFPTNLRATSRGTCAICGRIGTMTAPLMAYATKSAPWLPNIIMGSVAIFVGLISMNLPETFDKPLALKIDDIDRMYGKKKRTKSNDEMHELSERT